MDVFISEGIKQNLIMGMIVAFVATILQMQILALFWLINEISKAIKEAVQELKSLRCEVSRLWGHDDCNKNKGD